MPQMAPLSWMFMFTIFSVLFMLSVTKVYFTFLTKNSISLINQTRLNKSLIWLW